MPTQTHTKGQKKGPKGEDRGRVERPQESFAGRLLHRTPSPFLRRKARRQPSEKHPTNHEDRERATCRASQKGTGLTVKKAACKAFLRTFDSSPVLSFWAFFLAFCVCLCRH